MSSIAKGGGGFTNAKDRTIASHREARTCMARKTPKKQEEGGERGHQSHQGSRDWKFLKLAAFNYLQNHLRAWPIRKWHLMS